MPRAGRQLLDRHTYSRFRPGRATTRLQVIDRHPEADPVDRVRAVRTKVAELCVTEPPLAVAWYPSQQWVDPELLLDRQPGSPFGEQPLYGVANVRFFRGAPRGPTRMDTIGLAALGWPDLQLQLDGQPPPLGARVLYEVASGLYLRQIALDGPWLVAGTRRMRWAPAPCLDGPRRRVWDLRPWA